MDNIELLSNTGYVQYNKAIAKTLGINSAIMIGELFAEYQRGVEQLLRDYNTLRNEVKRLDKGTDNSTVSYRNKSIGYGSRIYFIC